MFKVISAEIKKILSKPSIYILAVVLAAILILGVFIYNPTTNENKIINLGDATYTVKYEQFNDSTTGYKKIVTDNINDSIYSVAQYRTQVGSDTYTKQAYINLLYEDVIAEFYEYRNYASYDGELSPQLGEQKNKLKTSIKTLDTTINSSIEQSLYGSYSMISTTENYKNYSTIMKEILTWVEMSPERESLATHCKEFEQNLKPKLEVYLSSFIYPNVSADFIKSYTMSVPGTKLFQIHSRLANIELEMKKINDSIKTDADNIKLSNKMDELVNAYVNTANIYTNLVKYELLCNAFDSTSTDEELDLLHLKSYSDYNNKSLLVKYEYLFKNNKTEQDFSNPLTIGTTSNAEINAYDYAYFSLKLFSFVIIAYSVMLACNSIAGEIKEGTMRYFAIRPISRMEIYFGKLFSIIILSSILLIFSSIISICVGGAVYGFNSLNILTVFNGSTAIVLHPIVMIILLLLSLIFELAIYTSLALLLSTLIKTDALAVTIILIIYLVNIMLPLFVQGANTWLSYYPFSHISIFSLFGSAVYANNHFFNMLLGAKVYATTGLWLTIFVILTLIVSINLIAAKIFKNKEL